MKIIPINNISFRNSQPVVAEQKEVTSPVPVSVNNSHQKNNNSVAYIALGTAIGLGLLMHYRTSYNRIKNITGNNSGSTLKNRGGHCQIDFVDLQNDPKVKSLDELSGLQPLKDFCESYITLSKNPKIAEEHQVENFYSLLFWGLPGTGKTTGAKGFAKKIGADFAQINKEDFASMFLSEDSRRLNEIFDQIYNHATKNNDKPVVVFMDEFDATIAIDRSNLAKHSNDLIDTLKIRLTDLQTTCHNIIFIGATNKDPSGIKTDQTGIELNSAILDRLKEVVEFKLPQKENVEQTWAKLTRTKSGIDKFTKEECSNIADVFVKLEVSYRDIGSTADKMNRADAVEYSKTKSFNSKRNLLDVMKKDEKLGYDPVQKKSKPKKFIEAAIAQLEEYFYSK